MFNAILEPDGVRWTDAVLHAKLHQYMSDQAKSGWSKLAVFEQEGRFIGRAGVSRFGDTGELELGYSFARAHWGKGYATEAASALLKWIYGAAAVAHVIAFAMVSNATSIRVLDRIGMTRTNDRVVHGAPHAFYVHHRP